MIQMAEFKSLTEIQKYLEKSVAEIVEDSMQLESYLAEKMRDSILAHVYAAYPDPPTYERRGDDGGLSDTRNMEITNISVTDGEIRLLFENLTEGNDNLEGEYISGLIEFGNGFDGKHWDNPSGTYARPRPFVAKMMEEIIANPGTLIRLLKSELFNAGFKVE